MMIPVLNIGLAGILAIICTWTDLKYMTIYNKYTYSAAAVGLMYSLATKQYSHISGALIVFAMYLILFIMGNGKLGGGDLKLAVALSLFIGQEPIVYGSIISGILMMVWGFASTWVRSGELQTATMVMLGKLPGGVVPFGSILGPVSVIIGIMLAI